MDDLQPPQLESLERWLSHRFDRHVHITGVGRAKDGFSNDTVLFRAGGPDNAPSFVVDLVLRRSAERRGLYPVQSESHDSTIEVQAQIMATLHDAGIRVPRVIGLEADESVLGGAFLVMERVTGEVPNDLSLVGEPGVLHHARPEQRRTLVEDTLAELAHLHALDWRAAGLGWLDRTDGGSDHLGPQLELWWSYATTHLHGRRHPVLFEAIDWLRDNRPRDATSAVVWGDARLPNTICGPGLRCQALLDWEGAAILPPEVDIAYWLLSDMLVHERRNNERLPGMPTRSEQLEMYERAAGRPVEHLGYYEVFAAMRVCALMLTTIPRLVARGLHPPSADADIANAYTDLLAEVHRANRRSW